MRGHLLQRLSIGLAILLTPAAARAEPARIIIMRHAEKLNAYALCDLGAQRGQALVSQFLGRGAAQSLFATAEKPDAILAITLHTIETVTPVAQSWNLPVIGYSVMPKEEKTAKDLDINRRTQEAAHDVLSDPRYAGKTVVMIWEHKHIAHPKLEKDFPGEQVTLRQLLRLDQVAGVPRDWPNSNYRFLLDRGLRAGQIHPDRVPHGPPGFYRPLRQTARQRLGRAGASTHTRRVQGIEAGLQVTSENFHNSKNFRRPQSSCEGIVTLSNGARERSR